MDEVGWASDSKYKYYLYRLPLVFATQPPLELADWKLALQLTGTFISM